MRTVLVTAMALGMAVWAAGCGHRSHEDVQKDMTKLAEELAQVMSSDMDKQAKLKKVAEISDSMKKLTEEANELGSPPKKPAKLMATRYRERDRVAAEKLEAAAAKMKQDSPK